MLLRAGRARRDLQRRRRQRGAQHRADAPHPGPGGQAGEPHPPRDRPPGPRPALQPRLRQAARAWAGRRRCRSRRAWRATVEWYREHEDWWRPIKEANPAFREHYQRHYAGLTRARDASSITGIAGFVGGHLVDFLRARAARRRRCSASISRRGTLPELRPRGRAGRGRPRGRGRPSSAALDRGARPTASCTWPRSPAPQRSWDDPGGHAAHERAGPAAPAGGACARAAWRRACWWWAARRSTGCADAARPAAARGRAAAAAVALRGEQGRAGLPGPAVRAVLPACPSCARAPSTTPAPRRGEAFAESSFARQLAEIEAGPARRRARHVGNLDAVRDFTDVRDVVRAYWALLERGAPGEVYNVCSGRGVAHRRPARTC